MLKNIVSLPLSLSVAINSIVSLTLIFIYKLFLFLHDFYICFKPCLSCMVVYACTCSL